MPWLVSPFLSKYNETDHKQYSDTYPIFNNIISPLYLKYKEGILH